MVASNRCDFIHSTARIIGLLSGFHKRRVFSIIFHDLSTAARGSLDESLLCLRSARINRKGNIWKGNEETGEINTKEKEEEEVEGGGGEKKKGEKERRKKKRTSAGKESSKKKKKERKKQSVQRCLYVLIAVGMRARTLKYLDPQVHAVR